ncbi:MAG: ATP phosphoribosyltransferase [Candidatus Aminicenantes bacterium]|nr:ATP phosphoribosyltransferase [Candidatus Aminicenantes bacterium]
MAPSKIAGRLRLVLPKGRLYPEVARLLNDAGVGVEADDRVYHPKVSWPDLEAKIIKPQNIPKLIELGSHDLGFAGADWVREAGAAVREVLDLGFDPVRVVAAVPAGLSGRALRRRRIVVASEYERIARTYLDANRFDYVLLRTFGATEVFPPDDADMIIDNVATGRTLCGHGLRILAVILESTTRVIVHPRALDRPWKRDKVEELLLLFRSVLDARRRVMIEMNVPSGRLEAIVKRLPCMRSPTVAPLYGRSGYAVKVAVERTEAARLIPRLKKLGACDILESRFEKVVP